MNNLKKLVILLLMVFSVSFLVGCESLEGLVPPTQEGGNTGGNTGGSNTGGNYDEAETLMQIYRLSVSQGYTGSYQDWLNELKGDSVEFRVYNGFIQWRYSSSSSWANLYQIDALKGEQGLQGEKGEQGLPGQQGVAGKPGENGLTPHVGENGNWWLGNEDTGVKAEGKGEDGEDGLTPYVGENGNWWLGNEDTGVKAEGKGEDGEDGLTPHVGENGNWWLGDEDTGVKAEGKGEDGEDGLTPHVGENGNWWLGDEDTEVKAEAVGETGKSAFESFKELHPEYVGDEAQWVSDLVNGKLFDINYEYFTVKFDDGEGNILSEQSVMSSRPAIKPEDPIKQGYIFAGWYANGEKWSFDSNVVLKDIILEANWIRSNAQPNMRIDNVWSDTKNLYFSIYEDNFCEIESIALYLEGRELVQTLDNLAKREFNNLYSNRYYEIQLTYSYDMNDGMGKQTGTYNYGCSTSSLSSPSYWTSNYSNTHDSISFEMFENDYDNIGYIAKIEVYLNDEMVKQIDEPQEVSPNKYEISGLLSGFNYRVYINYVYDLNDGNPINNYDREFWCATNTLYEPTVELANIKSTQNNITGEVLVTDMSGINEIVSVELYKGNELVYTGTELNLNYTELEANTKYNIIVNYQYDLNNGNGKVEKKIEYAISTHPVYSLLSTNILNTSTILEGDTVYLYAEVDNPSSATFTKVYVNGKAYDVNPASTNQKIYASIYGLEAGTHNIVLEKMITQIDGSEFEYYTEDSNTTTVNIYKGLQIESIEMVDEMYETRYHYFNDEAVYIKLNVNNPDGYSLDSVKIGGSQEKIINKDELIKVDDYTYIVPFGAVYGYEQFRLEVQSYSYSSDDFEKQMDGAIEAYYCDIVPSEIVEISTVDDLLNTDFNQHRYYKLMNDIDLSNVEWKPIPYMRGIFDGNGYAIKNMRIVGTYNNCKSDFGFINQLSGSVINLSFESAVIMLTLPNCNSYEISIGTIASHMWSGNIINCHIDENSSISIEGSYHVRVGAIVGYADNTVIADTSNKANINVKKINEETNYSLSAGAFVGYSGYTIIKKSYNTGNIVCDGGFSSIFSANFHNTEIYDSYNTGSYNGEYGLRINYSEDLDVNNNCYSAPKEYANQTLNWTEKTYSFVTNVGLAIDDVKAVVLYELPQYDSFAPYYFLGWYDNPEFEGEPITGPYFSNEDCTLYSKWAIPLDQEEMKKHIDNNDEYPFENRDGNFVSTIPTNITGYSTFYIRATEKIRVYFDVEVKLNKECEFGIGRAQQNNPGSYSEYWYNINQINEMGYVDLNVNEFIEFRCWGGTYMSINNLVIVENK